VVVVAVVGGVHVSHNTGQASATAESVHMEASPLHSAGSNFPKQSSTTGTAVVSMTAQESHRIGQASDTCDKFTQSDKAQQSNKIR
jgi:hypothetical protein